MRRPALRFRPPPLVVAPELRWVLLRAFGPPASPAPAGIAAASCYPLAAAFDVAPRIAQRVGRAALAAELGEAAAARFHHDRQAAAANALRLGELVEAAAAAAAELALPVVFLKFAALQLAGFVAPGSRWASDVDLLVPAARARELFLALLDAGFHAASSPEHEHQLPALLHPVAGVVEIHRSVPGLRLAAGTPSATADALLAAERLVVPCPELPGRCARPATSLLAAHALVHGLVQHGHHPAAYPLLRTVADLVDLGLAGPEGEALAGAAGRLVAAELSAAEVEAARGLAVALAAGDLPAAGGGAWLLLAHVAAGCLDPDYRQAQRLALFARQPGDRPRPLQVAATLWRTLVPTRGQIDALYGPQGSAGGYLLRRLARPFDLLARWRRYQASRRRVRRQR